MITASVSIDVPDLEAGIRFYASALGFARQAEPCTGGGVMRADTVEICLLEKAAGTTPSPRTAETGCYQRH